MPPCSAPLSGGALEPFGVLVAVADEDLRAVRKRRYLLLTASRKKVDECAVRQWRRLRRSRTHRLWRRGLRRSVAQHFIEAGHVDTDDVIVEAPQQVWPDDDALRAHHEKAGGAVVVVGRCRDRPCVLQLPAQTVVSAHVLPDGVLHVAVDVENDRGAAAEVERLAIAHHGSLLCDLSYGLVYHLSFGPDAYGGSDRSRSRWTRPRSPTLCPCRFAGFSFSGFTPPMD